MASDPSLRRLVEIEEAREKRRRRTVGVVSGVLVLLLIIVVATVWWLTVQRDRQARTDVYRDVLSGQSMQWQTENPHLPVTVVRA